MRNARPVEQPVEANAEQATTDSQAIRIGGLSVPAIDSIHRRVYDAASKPGALNMCNWHDCQTTHCRAGWIVNLAGDAGYALERATSPLFAAQQIYRASGYEISPVRFYDSDQAAIEDMRRLAEQEAAKL